MASGLPWGLALASGVNTYLPLFLLALLARFGHMVHLSTKFEWLVSDQAILIFGLLALMEILAEKFPVLDNVWDLIHTFLRPLAGAVAAGATLSTDKAFETLIAMLLGGTLAGAAHSAKSGLRLMTTSKSFGTANFILGIGEDAAVVTGTLLSIYAPWVMLGIVILFVALFALVGPRLLRTLVFDVRIISACIRWAWRKVWRVPPASRLQDSLLELPSERLERLRNLLSRDERLLGVVEGWRRSRRGPRGLYLLVTEKRLLMVEPRLFRRPSTKGIPFGDLAVARYRNLILFGKLEVLTHQNENYILNIRKTESTLAGLAARAISELAELAAETAGPVPQISTTVAVPLPK